MHVWFAYMHSSTILHYIIHTRNRNKCVMCVRFVLCIRTQTCWARLSTLPKREHTHYRAQKKSLPATERETDKQFVVAYLRRTQTNSNGICLRKCLYSDFESKSMQDIERDSIQSNLHYFSFPMNLSEQFSAKSIAAHFYHNFMV